MGAECTFGTCGQPARPYIVGPRCPAHTPAALAGQPEPDSARYCLAICYCGQCSTRPVPLAEYREAQARTRTGHK